VYWVLRVERVCVFESVGVLGQEGIKGYRHRSIMGAQMLFLLPNFSFKETLYMIPRIESIEG